MVFAIVFTNAEVHQDRLILHDRVRNNQLGVGAFARMSRWHVCRGAAAVTGGLDEEDAKVVGTGCHR